MISTVKWGILPAAQAHAKMLGKQGLFQEESELIIQPKILADIEAGKVEFTIEAEDIHMNIETLLTERIGQTGKKLRVEAETIRWHWISDCI